MQTQELQHVSLVMEGTKKRETNPLHARKVASVKLWRWFICTSSLNVESSLCAPVWDTINPRPTCFQVLLNDHSSRHTNGSVSTFALCVSTSQTNDTQLPVRCHNICVWKEEIHAIDQEDEGPLQLSVTVIDGAVDQWRQRLGWARAEEVRLPGLLIDHVSALLSVSVRLLALLYNMQIKITPSEDGRKSNPQPAYSCTAKSQ